MITNMRSSTTASYPSAPGRAVARGIQRFNAVYARADTVEDLNFQQSPPTAVTTRQIMYPSPGKIKDRSILAGEIVYTKKVAWQPSTPDQPPVRSLLNGVIFTSKRDPANESPADKIARQRKELRASHSLRGVALKTVIHDSENVMLGPSDDPIVAVTGKLTMINSGQRPIDMFQAAQASLPDKSVRFQYEDGVNYFSPARLVYQIEPLEMHKTFAGLYNNPNDVRFKNAWVEVFGVLDAASGNDELGKKCQKSLESLMASPDYHNKMRLDAMLATLRAAVISQMRKFVGQAITGAERGQKINVNVQRLANLVTRASDPTLRTKWMMETTP